MPANTVVPPPPRLNIARPSGDHATDIAALHEAVQAIHEYLGRLHNSAVVESGLLDPSRQLANVTFDPAAITDPTKATIASAQATANAAYARSLLP